MNRPSSPMNLSLLSEPIGPIDETDLVHDDRVDRRTTNSHDDGRSVENFAEEKGDASIRAPSWNDWDVPIGRGRAVREFIGNERYRNLIETHRPAYLQAKKRKDKRDVSLTIYNIIKSNGGRFLAPRGTQNESWYQITKDKALAKIGQALRIGVRPPQPLYSSWTYPIDRQHGSMSDRSGTSETPTRPLFVNVPDEERYRRSWSHVEVMDSVSNLSYSSEDPMLMSAYTSREFEFNHNDNSPEELTGDDWSSLDPRWFA